MSQGTRIFYTLIALLVGATLWLGWQAEKIRRAPHPAPAEATKP